MKSSEFDWFLAQADQYSRLAQQAEQTRKAAEQLDSGLLAQVERARKAGSRLLAEMPQLDPGLLAQVEQARKAGAKLLAEMPRLGPSLLAQVEQAHRAAEQLDPGLLAQVERARKAGAKLLAEVPQLDPGLLAQVERARKATGKLLAEMPQLTPELFGGAWNERVAGAVRRLERTATLAEDIHGATAADAATVRDATPTEAQERVEIWLSGLRVRRWLALLKEFYSWVTIISTISTFLGVPVPDLPTAQEPLPTARGLLGEPDRPRVPMPDLPTTREIEPAGEPDRLRVPAGDDPAEAAAQLDTLTGDDMRDAEIARDRLDEIDSDPNAIVRGAELERRLAELV